MAQTSAAKGAAQNKSANGIDPRRQAALDTALAQVEKSSQGSAMRLGDRPERCRGDSYWIAGIGYGIGYRRPAEGPYRGDLWSGSYGQDHTGVACGGQCPEKRWRRRVHRCGTCAFDPVYARKLGVDTDSLIVSQPDNGEQALEIADMLIRSGALDVIVIDSVAALVPKAEIEGEMGDSHVGLQARLMSQALRKMTGALAQAGTTAIFINQL